MIASLRMNAAHVVDMLLLESADPIIRLILFLLLLLGEFLKDLKSWRGVRI